MVDAKRGGARPGAGRPKGETTTMVRVPDGCLEQVRQLISVYRNGGELPSVPAQQIGDAHLQVDLPLPGDEALTPAKRAWSVYFDLRCTRQGTHLLEENLFKLVKISKVDYTYLFMLQLLEHLFSLPVPWDSCAPVEWIKLKSLRSFTDKLYKANPQWH